MRKTPPNLADCSPRERCAIEMAAILRGDMNEQARVASFAQHTKWTVADTCGIAHGIGYAVHTACCHLLEAAGMWLRLSGAGCGLGLEDKPPEVVEEATDWAMSAALVWAFIFSTKRQGWELFCEELGLDAAGWQAALPGDFLLKETEKAIDGLIPTSEWVLEWLRGEDKAERLAESERVTSVMTAERFKSNLMAIVDESEAVWS